MTLFSTSQYHLVPAFNTGSEHFDDYKRHVVIHFRIWSYHVFYLMLSGQLNIFVHQL